jgi:NTP pyrophosphatase (non-canonical NTP hydrolase)
MDISDLSKAAHYNAKNKGLLDFDTHQELKSAVVDKLVEEIEEFFDSKPKGDFDKNSEQSEIADIILVLFSYCEESGYDIEKLLNEKIQFNITRPYKHGKDY